MSDERETSHLRIADDEIWIVIFHDFDPAWDFAWLLHTRTHIQTNYFFAITL